MCANGEVLGQEKVSVHSLLDSALKGHTAVLGEQL